MPVTTEATGIRQNSCDNASLKFSVRNRRVNNESINIFTATESELLKSMSKSPEQKFKAEALPKKIQEMLKQSHKYDNSFSNQNKFMQLSSHMQQKL